ncbi:MAG: glycoside hydrolase domain-containing protein, partial [Chitinophagaceae bacterium]
MKKIFLIIIVLLFNSFLQAQDVSYTSGTNGWKEDSLGNHRAIVLFTGKGSVARVSIQWRRPDHNPQLKRIIIEDAKTGTKITNVKTGAITNESGDLFFEPLSGAGTYYVYYMPYKNEGRSNYPKGVYLLPEETASSQWLQTIVPNMPFNAMVKSIQSINDFNSFYPMEVIATEKEKKDLISKNKSLPFIIFPEDRMFPIKMKNTIPERWVHQSSGATFSGEADRGEYYAYQLGIWALQDLNKITINFTDLKSKGGGVIPAGASSCINYSGVDYTGKPFRKLVSVPKNGVQAMWCGVEVPIEAKPGIYSGKAVISANGNKAQEVAISITVTNTIAVEGGVNEPQKQTRLKWLNSTMAQENTVIAPYTPLQVQGLSIQMLGRKVLLNNDGFPAQIQTFFTPEMTGFQKDPNNILAAAMQFEVTPEGKKIDWQYRGVKFIQKSAGTVQWTATTTSETLQMDVAASLEFDGFIHYSVSFRALKDIELKDIALRIPYNKEAAKYLMGLGQKGGNRPDNFSWKWDVATKNQDGAWIGNVAAGLQFSLRDEKYVRPLNTNFYLQKPLLLPQSWGNGEKGGITVKEKGKEVMVTNFSGERSMKKGDVLYYNFTLLITPFHPINTDFQWATRFYHKYDNLETIKATGATVANIHHATAINPWINYPFIEWKKMKEYIDAAHSKGLKVKIYNTVRELSNHAYETFPMRSLGHEIYSPGKGGGYSWLQEHLDSDYIAAWFVPEIKDAAIVNSGMSRWHNYYVEGMNWLVQHVGIDGIYLDDVAFDRVTMKRIKRVLTKDGHPGIIDLHSANQYNKSDGFNNSANLYLEHFPYLNRLWFGEYFDYEKSDPDFFMTEVSGIPFGLMGEMLQNGGNPWRGMI